MKLFTRKEIQEKKQESLDSLRAKEAAVVKTLNAKTQELNDTIPVIEQTIREKKDALSRVEFEHRTFLKTMNDEVSILEDRRKAALKPIEKERREIEDKKLEISRLTLQMGEKQLEVSSQLETLRRESSDMEQVRRNLEITRQETIAELNSERQKALEVIEASKAAVKALQGEQEALREVRKESEERFLMAERAEMNVRAGMIAADKRIELEKIEQKKTDDKRKMLSVAISELKRRGLWQTRYETQTK